MLRHKYRFRLQMIWFVAAANEASDPKVLVRGRMADSRAPLKGGQNIWIAPWWPDAV